MGKWRSKRNAIFVSALSVLLCAFLLVMQLVNSVWVLAILLAILEVGLIAMLIYTIRRDWPWQNSNP